MHAPEPARQAGPICANMKMAENSMTELDRSNLGTAGPQAEINSVQSRARPRLVYITTHPIALRRLLVGQLAYFQQHGYEVLGVASPGPDLEVVGPREGVQTAGVPMEREISPLKDFVSLLRLIRLFRRYRPDAICAGTSKASLLGLLAARIVRVPARIYMLHGLRLETSQGMKRRILAAVERLTSACAHRVMAISPSLCNVYAEMGLAPREKLRVLGHGSSNGVNPKRFLPTPEMREQTAQLRAKWGVTDETPLIGFLGRFVKDKGVTDIIDAFDLVLKDCPTARLLMVGEFESGDPVPDSYVQRIQTDQRIIWPGYADEPGAVLLGDGCAGISHIPRRLWQRGDRGGDGWQTSRRLQRHRRGRHRARWRYRNGRAAERSCRAGQGAAGLPDR